MPVLISPKTDVTPAILSRVSYAGQAHRIEQRSIPKTSRATVRRSITQRGPTKSRPEPSGAVRNRPDTARSRPDAARSRPDARLGQSRVELVQDQHETCDAVLRFAIYSGISFCIT